MYPRKGGEHLPSLSEPCTLVVLLMDGLVGRYKFPGLSEPWFAYLGAGMEPGDVGVGGVQVLEEMKAVNFPSCLT